MNDNLTTSASNEAESHAFLVGAVTSRTLKCLKCKNYSIKVINDKGGTANVCNAKINDQRVIVDLDAPNCNDYTYGW